MVTLSIGDFIILLLMNLAVSYFMNFVKRSAELSAEESSSDKEYLKNKIRTAVSEARNVLTELRVHEFEIPTGRRRLARMNTLIEDISLADKELGSKIWGLVNTPVLVDAYSRIEENSPKVTAAILEIKNKSFKDLEWALERCAVLEKNPAL
ncbi:MAG: hypothetical protein V1922_04900 [bacterium]